jgi:hypothetical protein
MTSILLLIRNSASVISRLGLTDPGLCFPVSRIYTGLWRLAKINLKIGILNLAAITNIDPSSLITALACSILCL